MTEFGLVPISWRTERGRITYQFTVPQGVTATVALFSQKIQAIILDGKSLPAGKVTHVGNRLTVEVGSGTHLVSLGLPISSPPR